MTDFLLAFSAFFFYYKVYGTYYIPKRKKDHGCIILDIRSTICMHAGTYKVVVEPSEPNILTAIAVAFLATPYVLDITIPALAFAVHT